MQVLLGGKAAGVPVLVSDEDYADLADGWTWYLTGAGYAEGRKRLRNGVYLHALMHSYLMHPPDGMVVDHRNGEKLDNRRENLRVCTQCQNVQNRSASPNSSSPYKGVSWFELRGKWAAKIMHRRRGKHLGLYASEIEAAYAYNQAALQLRGDNARINSIPDGTISLQRSDEIRRVVQRSIGKWLGEAI